MRSRPSHSQTRKTKVSEETALAARQRQVRSWLILGAGALGVASAIAQWAVRARQQASRNVGNTRFPNGSLLTPELTAVEGTGTPVPLQEMPASATPTNDARTALITPSLTHDASEVAENRQNAVSSVTASPIKKTSSRKSVSSANAEVSIPETSPSTSRQRGKMSEEYDQALQANTLPTDGREGERALHERKATAMTANTSASNDAQAGSPAPSVSANSPAEQAFSTQAESKMAIGEELRDREFPVPPQDTNIPPQKLVIDQETMPDGGLRPGGIIGTAPGDHQNKGEVGDIMDQSAETPDFAQQR